MTTNLLATFVLVLFVVFRWIFASAVHDAWPILEGKACDPKSKWNSICREKNAQCLVISGRSNCSCSNGLEMVNETCQITKSYCVENGAQAVVTITEPPSVICYCEPDQFFDYDTSQCHTVDLCPFIQCEGKFEKCQGSKCECKTGYERRSGECQPKNYCLIDNLCGDAKCEPGPDDDPKRVRCFCDSGFILTREKTKIYCKLIRCEVGSLNVCDQVCSYTPDQKNTKCGCFPGHTQQPDNMTCVNNQKCTFNSCPSEAVCVENKGKRTCYCKSGFIYNNTCIDLCSAGKLRKDVCPNECRKTDGGFQCVCTGKYKLSRNMITCEERQMCLEGESGFANCSSKNRTCIEKPTLEEGYECGGCLLGLELDNGICTDFCSLDEYKEFCFKNGGTCSYVNIVTKKAHCKCPPLFTYEAEIGCVFAKYSYTALLQILNDYQIENENKTLSLDKNSDGWSKLCRDVDTTLTTMFGSAISKTNILSCRPMNQDVICKIEMQMNFPSQSLFQRLTSGELCKSATNIPQDLCFLPPFLKLRINSYDEDTFKPSRACDVQYGDFMCPVSTECVDEGVGFSCKCKKGFVATSSTYFSRDGKGEVQMCQDIDECKKEDICPSETICKNTIGDYECICKPGLVHKNSRLDSKISDCFEICDIVNCGHGICNQTYSGGYYCECYEGYSGEVCEIATKEVKDIDKGKVASMVIAIIEGLVLLVLIPALFYISCFQRIKKVPQRGGAVNNAKLKTTKNTISAPLQNLNRVPVVNSQSQRDRTIANHQAEQEEAIYADCEYVNM